ncbi:MAG TPA: hypothetical protein VJ622_02360, partial [Acidimicrobiia bacterium]|nr:hypothetical protein [Acidimicrobiia bacterium]
MPIAQPGCKLEDTSTEAAPTQRQLGVYDGDPTIDLVLPPRSFLAVRPLTDDEIVVLPQLLAADADRHAPAGGVGAGGGYRPDLGMASRKFPAPPTLRPDLRNKVSSTSRQSTFAPAYKALTAAVAIAFQANSG